MFYNSISIVNYLYIIIFRFNRVYPIVSLSGNLKTSSWCCGLHLHNTPDFNGTHIRRLKLYRERRRRSQPTSIKSQPDDPATISVHAHEDEIPKATLVWRAIKLPIYSVALVPLTVSCCCSKKLHSSCTPTAR